MPVPRNTPWLPTLLRILLGYLAAVFVAFVFFPDLRKAVSTITAKAMEQTPYWPPVAAGGDTGPPSELFNVIWLTALFLSAPWTAHQIHRRWLPSLDWRHAQAAAALFIAAGLLGHFAIYPAILRNYPFHAPLVIGHTTPILFTIHSWTVLLTSTILTTLAAALYTPRKTPN